MLKLELTPEQMLFLHGYKNTGLMVPQPAKASLLSIKMNSIDYLFHQAEAKCVKKYIPAERVNRYFQIDHDDLFLIYLQRDTDISFLPNIRVHLNRFRNLLENRAEIRRNSKREWWHLLWPRDPEIYDVPKKIATATATAHNSFYMDDEQTYYNIGCTILSPTSNIAINPLYILAVLNSRLLDLYYGIKGQTQLGINGSISQTKFGRYPSAGLTSPPPPTNATAYSEKPKSSTNAASTAAAPTVFSAL